MKSLPGFLLDSSDPETCRLEKQIENDPVRVLSRRRSEVLLVMEDSVVNIFPVTNVDCKENYFSLKQWTDLIFESSTQTHGPLSSKIASKSEFVLVKQFTLEKSGLSSISLPTKLEAQFPHFSFQKFHDLPLASNWMRQTTLFEFQNFSNSIRFTQGSILKCTMCGRILIARRTRKIGLILFLQGCCLLH